MATVESEPSGIAELLEEFIGQAESGVEPNLEALMANLEPSDHDEFLQLVQQYLSFKQGAAPSQEASPEIFGSFKITGQLGRGGSSLVYAAVDATGRKVALKVLPAEMSFNPTFIKRFEREYHVLQELDHPHIVRVFDFGVIDGRPFLSMELHSGGTFEDWLQARASTADGGFAANSSRIIDVISKIAKASEAVHKHGIVHRDIKPSNILFDSSGNPCLSDFGLAHLDTATALTTEGKVLGTLAYMAPERLMDSAPEDSRGATVDIYALGVTLFQGLTGALPFNGRFPEILALIQKGPPPLSLFCTKPVSPAMDAIIGKCLEPKARYRYSTMGELVSDLQAVSESGKVLALRHIHLRRFRKAWAAHPRLSFLFAILLCSAAYLQVNQMIGSLERNRRLASLLENAETYLNDLETSVADIGLSLNTTSEDEAQRWRRLSMARENAEESFFDGERVLISALTLDPDSILARDAITQLFMLKGKWMEFEGDPTAAEDAWITLQRYRPDLKMPLSVVRIHVANAEGATFRLTRYVTDTDVQPWPMALVAEGLTPQSDFHFSNLTPGSYRFEFQIPGAKRTIYSPFIVCPGESLHLPDLTLPSDEDLGEDWAYIPSGKFIYGGDPDSNHSQGRMIVQESEFFISINEMTMEFYDQFLQSNLEFGCIHSHGNLVPYTAGAHFPWDRILAFKLQFPGDLEPKIDGEFLRGILAANVTMNQTYAFRPYSAAHGISMDDASHFVYWLNQKVEQEGDPWIYSLPTQRQWEKAARGADGRLFTWGNNFDWDLPTSIMNSNWSGVGADQSNAMGIARTLTDLSPYGCIDMVGNVREFTVGKALFGAPTGVLCGGEESFDLPDRFRLDSRSYASEGVTNWDFGIRLVRQRR